ncbi:GNAT family N-acetyltransferase [Deinococcus pimensis]|uniref:GNAT family N-acetyltransferase n=1 Tax=Deinococcus pimensis TaxID=309888 RepID=UPI0004836831|nr:GNAT family N-acetyltransferase [Deinococcus pimensis]
MSTTDATRTDVHPTVQFFEDMLDHVFVDPERTLVERGAGYALATTFASSPDLNLVYVEPGDAAPFDPVALAARLGELRVPFLCVVTPGGVSAGASDALTGAGIPPLSELPIMTVSFDRLREQDADVPGLDIGRVRTSEDWKAWCAACGDAFDFTEEFARSAEAALRASALDPASRARYYVARLDGEPVGTTLAVLGRQEVGLWCIGTAKAARRRGVGAAMTTAPLLDARGEGYTTARLGATPMGFPVYERLGWTVEHRSPFHLFQPPGVGATHA